MSQVFAALASAERRRMLDLVRVGPGITIAGLARHFDMSGVAVLKHVRVLEACGLLETVREGRERRLYFNVLPIQRIHDRWTDQYSRFWAGWVVDLKDRLESGASSTKHRRVKRA